MNKSHSKIALFFGLCLLLVFFVIIRYDITSLKRIRDLKKGLSDKIEYIRFSKCDCKNGLSLEPFEMIAHAGGGIYGLNYTNSLEALDSSYEKGFRWIEMDISKTKDNKLVMLHDWGSAIPGLFNEKEGIYSLEEFKNFKMVKDLTPLSLDDALNWFEEHDDAYFVTDIKENNVEVLSGIIHDYPEIKERIIPQAYSFKEYCEIKSLGFKGLILTLYQANYHENLVIDFIKRNEVTAVTMPMFMVDSTNLVERLKENGVFVYTHTVNTKEEKEKYSEQGIAGFYTDFLDTEKCENGCENDADLVK